MNILFMPASIIIDKILNGMQSSCSCKDLGLFDNCDFCIEIKYLINFHTYKFCIKNIPENIAQYLVALERYLRDELKTCKPFIYFIINKIAIKLDNPLLKDMENVKKVGN